jgi:hypothetical protein
MVQDGEIMIPFYSPLIDPDPHQTRLLFILAIGTAALIAVFIRKYFWRTA